MTCSISFSLVTIFTCVSTDVSPDSALQQRLRVQASLWAAGSAVLESRPWPVLPPSPTPPATSLSTAPLPHLSSCLQQRVFKLGVGDKKRCNLHKGKCCRCLQQYYCHYPCPRFWFQFIFYLFINMMLRSSFCWFTCVAGVCMATSVKDSVCVLWLGWGSHSAHPGRFGKDMCNIPWRQVGVAINGTPIHYYTQLAHAILCGQSCKRKIEHSCQKNK